MSPCPYSEELLDKWDSVMNPIGDACCDCDNYECEHNLNNPEDFEFDYEGGEST